MLKRMYLNKILKMLYYSSTMQLWYTVHVYMYYFTFANYQMVIIV